MEQEPNQSNDIDQNIAADWEGVEDIEQELQTKIKSNMEQLPKTKHEQEAKTDKRKVELTEEEINYIESSIWSAIGESVAPDEEYAKALIKKLKSEE